MSESKVSPMALAANPGHKPGISRNTSVTTAKGTAQRNRPEKLTFFEKKTMATPKATLAKLERSMATSKSTSS